MSAELQQSKIVNKSGKPYLLDTWGRFDDRRSFYDIRKPEPPQENPSEQYVTPTELFDFSNTWIAKSGIIARSIEHLFVSAA
ncbi:hypothetical protein GF380_04325, partial [Candidatus Uhrbacteria bacterium]|nr:hypothetical protein [Candidatus Uhrbacteria bacterium]